VKIEIEGATREEVLARDLGVPGGQQLGCLGAVDTVRVFGKVAFLGNGIEATKQRQSFVGGKCHDVALALQRPELEGQASAQGVGGRDHLRAWQAGSLCELLDAESQEVR
jgi:hypothetical protein